MKSVPWDGNPIARGGCYSGITLDQYHADLCIGPSTSSSALRQLYLKSPAHYYDESYLNPDRFVPDEAKMDREWAALGSAAHHLLVGGVGSFQNAFVLRPDRAPDGTGRLWNMNNKSCRSWVVDRHREGKIVLTKAQLETATRMSTNLGAEPIVTNGLLDGLVERSLVWRDSETGIWLKARPDVLLPASAEVVDLKTTRSTQLPDLVRTTDENAYHMQAALVADGMKTVFNLNMVTFILVWLEKPRPNCVRITTMSQDDIERGRRMYRVALRTLADCIEMNYWPGPGYDADVVAELKLSVAARERIDQRLKREYGPKREAA